MSNSIQEQPSGKVDLKSSPSPAERPYDYNNHLQKLDIHLEKSSRDGFGFSIIGGVEYSSPISIGHIEKYGSADRDGRLKLDDIILHVNNISFIQISHQRALRVFKLAGKYIKMCVQRAEPSITLCPSNNLLGFSIAGSMIDAIGNTDIVILTRNITPSISDAEIRAVNKNDEKLMVKSRNRNTRPVREYELGTYEDLKRRSARGGDIEIHQLIQTTIAATLIPEYNEAEAICIALRRSKYHRVLTRPQNQLNSPLSDYNSKEALAHAIGWNIKPRVIPSPVLLGAIRLHCQKFPHIYEKPNLSTLSTNANIISCGEKELVIQIPFMDLSFVGTLEDIMAYGNCVKDLPDDVHQFLLGENRQREKDSGEYKDLSGKYVVHRYIDPITGKPRSLTLHIEFDHSKTDEEESIDYITAITTYNYNVFLLYE